MMNEFIEKELLSELFGEREEPNYGEMDYIKAKLAYIQLHGEVDNDYFRDKVWQPAKMKIIMGKENKSFIDEVVNGGITIPYEEPSDITIEALSENLDESRNIYIDAVKEHYADQEEIILESLENIVKENPEKYDSVEDLLNKEVNYDSMPQGLKEAQQANGVHDHKLYPLTPDECFKIPEVQEFEIEKEDTGQEELFDFEKNQRITELFGGPAMVKKRIENLENPNRTTPPLLGYEYKGEDLFEKNEVTLPEDYVEFKEIGIKNADGTVTPLLDKALLQSEPSNEMIGNTETIVSKEPPVYDWNSQLIKSTDVQKQEFIYLEVLGEPTAQKRHRSVRVGNFNRQYDPSEADKRDFLSIVQEYAPETPINSPIKLDIVFHFSRPKSHYRTGKNAHLLKDDVSEWHVARPDCDNCIKFVMDSLNKIYWRDDSLICSTSILKRYSTKPRTEITITKL